MLSDLPANTIFQHNGAPSYYSQEVQGLLDDKMPDS